MIIDSNFSVEQFSTQDQAEPIVEASENLNIQKSPSETLTTPPSRIYH
jgi:hypothetical protein